MRDNENMKKDWEETWGEGVRVTMTDETGPRGGQE